MSRSILNRGAYTGMGKQLSQSPSRLNMGTCGKCGTHNPTLPGEPLASRCSGCGSLLPKPTWRVTLEDVSPKPWNPRLPG